MSGARLVAIVTLLAANAFFVAAEFGLVAARRTRLTQLASEGNRRAKSAEGAVRQLNLMLSACQLGITFASLGLGWIGEPTLAHMLEGVFDRVPEPFDVIATHGTASAIAFAFITGLHIVLGELVPKNLAIAVPEGTALWVAAPLKAFAVAFRPFISLFNATANAIVRLLGVTPQEEVNQRYTSEELAVIFGNARETGELDRFQESVLAHALTFGEKRAGDAMTPRGSIDSVAADADIEQVLAHAEKTGHSRFPVYGDSHDDFVGIVHIKDALGLARRRPDTPVREAMRDIGFIPESVGLQTVFLTMQKEHRHLLVVVDEYGSPAGILTLEDILEELVGEIRDEYDVAEERIEQTPFGFRVPGRTRTDELAEATGCSLPDGDYDTVAGYMLARLGRMAEPGDTVTTGNWTLRVSKADGRRILAVDVTGS